MRLLKYWYNCLIELIYPDYCVACHTKLVNQEKVMCTHCLVEMPRTKYHKTLGNPVEKVFWGRVPIERATSLFFFLKEGKYQKLIHALKYKGRQDVGIELGKLLGYELKTESTFNQFDYVIPVPLHPQKHKKRGYNQSQLIAEGVALALDCKVNSKGLKRKKHTDTQTRKSRFERWENMAEVFEVVNPEQLEGKHILLVDDILTTGSTLEGCATALHQKANLKISIATLGYAILS